MKLKIYNDQEAPQWLAANVIRMSRFSEKSIKALTEAVIDSMITGTLKYSMIKQCVSCREQIGEVKAVLGSLHTILKQTVKYNLTEVMLSGDLQVLGLPYSYQLSVCRPYSDHKLELQRVLSSKMISREPVFDWDIQSFVDDDGRAAVSPSPHSQLVDNCVSIHIQSASLLEIQDGAERQRRSYDFVLSERMYYALSSELRKVDGLMSLYSTPK
ncbi:hypothetical protein AV274_4224 [Blastocystis sp. ATCC 50177/Nand II]|uniref:COMM domain-containing protein n=1 Tax=Blastocystis sp. subtype 1 (strain ATCC 50177 / NandII) TaxID=478820 RepID=A0A196SCJ5_BLAHN|nr:hypothetical protein AV274_4224 [Blastocystis sp. ATCC 50177/Nand II]